MSREGIMKKNLSVVPLVLLFCFTIACRDKAASAELEKYRAQAAVEEQNKALAMRFTDAYQKGDVAAIKEICSPDFVEHGVGRTFSLDQAIETLKGNMAIFSDFTITAEDIIAKGDKVAVRYLLKVTHTGEGLGIPATGKKAESAGIEILRFKDGKIAEAWTTEDVLGLLTQLGFELKPKEEKKT
jgi:predicted ester cyclase